MNVIQTKLPGVVIIEPVVHRDARGFFLEVFHAEKYRLAGVDAVFVQDNHSRSVRSTLRGLHAQRRNPQGKLVRVIEGEIFDVAVDLRPDSPTFRHWVGIHLTADNFQQLYIPPGLAHGFCVMSAVAQVEYKCTALYDPSDDFGIRWNDPDIGISWPVTEPVLSAKDAALPFLQDVLEWL